MPMTQQHLDWLAWILVTVIALDLVSLVVVYIANHRRRPPG